MNGRCEVHGDEPDPRTDPGAAIGWLELHYFDLHWTWLDDPSRPIVTKPRSSSCHPKRAPG